MTVEDSFLAAAEKAPCDRAAYLDAACGADAPLRAQVEALRAAVALRPSPGVLLNLGRSLYAQGDQPGAIAAYRQAIDSSPVTPRPIAIAG
jgi:hypothetical protein